ncbi:MAG TPA: class I SAM-dependent rRNA methyltransferase [Vicinamibacterales bacterium]|nr:class I SAM-dependent rRNA methyltransferase [Vicinamibacterales bacterium]
MPTATVSRRAEERIHYGHPWIYRSDVADVDAAAGDVVAVKASNGRPLGHALFSDRSLITLRMIARGDRPLSATWLRDRLRAAVAYRETLGIDASAFRLVHGEGDLLPSLIVDRYDDVLVIQTLSQGMARLQDEIVAALVELTSPRGILARNDPKVRDLEGLPRVVEAVHGDVPESLIVREGRVEMDVDLRHGQKTGLFLDQRENHEAAAGYARGRVLDCFSYQGGFALAAAARADEVIALDISEPAVERINAHAARNGIANVRASAVNVFDELRDFERAGERFDLVVLDPPAFAKNRASVPKALSGYKEINLRALKLLNPGGYLVTCSCSYNVDEGAFGSVVLDAAIDAHADVTVVEKRMQSRDHPVLLGVPETYYLKCFVLRRLS